MTARQLTAAAYQCDGWHRYPEEEPPMGIIIYQKDNGACGYGISPFKPGMAGIWKSLDHVPAKAFRSSEELLRWFQYEATVNPRKP